MPDVFALYVAAHRHALRQLITGCDPVEVEAAATGLRYLDPSHPVLPALYDKVEGLKKLNSASIREMSDAA